MSEPRGTADRRDSLAGLALAALPPAAGRDRAADSPPAADTLRAGLITREREPLNLKFPFRDLGGPVMPNNEFFVRTHFPMPALTAKDWTPRSGAS